jgi:hypothetical protein
VALDRVVDANLHLQLVQFTLPEVAYLGRTATRFSI